MIAHFPTPYPDELLYSVLARYYAESGYLAYIFAAQDLFERQNVKPDIEFVSRLTSAAVQTLTRYEKWEELIEKHTMLPYYVRFLNKERRHRAYVSLVNMEDGFRNLLCMPKSKVGVRRYLRYCPICAEADRNSYGETYWHRLHQMPGINVCASHHCRLMNSNVEISSNGSPALLPADSEIPADEAYEESDNVLECRLAEYMAEVFGSDLDMKNVSSVGEFLHSRLSGTKYVSRRGEQRNMTALYEDFCGYSRGLPEYLSIEQWQLQKIFSGDRVNMGEICLLAMFLKVPAKELVRMELPEKSQQEQFDELIRKMHAEGMNYAEIARRLGASYDVVKAIGESTYGKYRYLSSAPQKGGSKRLDWEKIDAETLPKVRKMIWQIQANTNDRPVRITVGLIERRLNLPEKSLRKCAGCRSEVEKYAETQEEHWARVIAWAENRILAEGAAVTLTGMMRMTNMRKRDILAVRRDNG